MQGRGGEKLVWGTGAVGRGRTSAHHIVHYIWAGAREGPATCRSQALWRAGWLTPARCLSGNRASRARAVLCVLTSALPRPAGALCDYPAWGGLLTPVRVAGFLMCF